MSAIRIGLADIEAAVRVIPPVFTNTPQYEYEPLGERLGARVLLKIETQNPIRSFKGRGASVLVSQLPAGQHIVCASAGNFGQAMAYACRSRPLRLTVYAARIASPLKVQRMRDLAAHVVLAGSDFEEAKLAAKRFAEDADCLFVEDSRDPATIEGAGTIGLELLEAAQLDAVLVPLGNGALVAGVGTVMKARSPNTRVVAVQAAGAPAMVESLRGAKVVVRERCDTIADGIAVRIPIGEVVEYLREVVDETILVSEPSILEGMRLLHEHAGIVPEPSSAVGIAALLEQGSAFADRLVATIVCGGNLTRDQLFRWLSICRSSGF